MKLRNTHYKFAFILFILFSTVFAFLQFVCFSRSWIDKKCPTNSDKQNFNHLQFASSLTTRSSYSSLTKMNMMNEVNKILPTIYLITPTYSRSVQKAELTRLSYTFAHVKNVHWILVEDSDNKTTTVNNFIKKTSKLFAQLRITHLNAPTPKSYKIKSKEPSWLKPRGVLQRNKALSWLREYFQSNNSLKEESQGVVYFADDDNTYDLKLFEEMRFTNTVSVWPVGLVGGLLVERPLVGSNGKVIGWNTLWRPERPFAIDMAGFAINLSLILNKPEVNFILHVQRGFQESAFLKQLIRSVKDLEPKADNCTKVYVWHTRTELPKLKQEERLKIPSNRGIDNF